MSRLSAPNSSSSGRWDSSQPQWPGQHTAQQTPKDKSRMRWSVGKRRCQKRVLAISCQRTGLRCSGASNITSRLALDSTLAVEAVCHSRHRGKRLSSKRGRHLPALPESAAGTPSGPPSGPSESDTHTHTHARTHARARAHTHTRRRCVAPAGGLVDFWGTAGWCGLRHPHRAGPAAAAGCGAGGSGNRWPRARRWTQSRGVVEGRGCGAVLSNCQVL